jgi:hypothetical protein
MLADLAVGCIVHMPGEVKTKEFFSVDIDVIIGREVINDGIVIECIDE